MYKRFLKAWITTSTYTLPRTVCSSVPPMWVLCWAVHVCLKPAAPVSLWANWLLDGHLAGSTFHTVGKHQQENRPFFPTNRKNLEGQKGQELIFRNQGASLLISVFARSVKKWDPAKVAILIVTSPQETQRAAGLNTHGVQLLPGLPQDLTHKKDRKDIYSNINVSWKGHEEFYLFLQAF